MFFSIDHYFEFKKRNATWKKEIIGGISTFFAMCYILAVNPSFMAQAINDTSINQSNIIGGLFLGTALVSFIATFIMGLVAKVPLCQAPGMGINVFFTYTVAMSFNLGYEGSLIVVMFSGILYLIIAITPLRQKMMEAFSENIKIAIGTMVGLFVAYIGLANMGIIQPGTWGAPSQIGTHFNNPIIIICIISTFILITLHYLKVRFAIIISAILTIIMLAIAYSLNAKDTQNIFVLNNYSDLKGFFDLSNLMWNQQVWINTLKNPLAYVAILTFLFVNFFDATGTMYTVSKTLNLSNNKTWLNKANIIEGCSTLISPLFLQSPVVSYVESNTAVQMGAKTGISAIVTSFMFLFSIALWPILNPILPISINSTIENASVQPVTGPILVLIGVLMIEQLKHFKWNEYIADIPMLLFTIAFGLLGFSISNGIAWGLTIYMIIGIIVAIKKIFIEIKEMKANGNKLNMKLLFNKQFYKKLSLPILITSLISLSYIIVFSLIESGVISL